MQGSAKCSKRLGATRKHLGAKLTYNKVHIEDTQILGSRVKNLVTRDLYTPGPVLLFQCTKYHTLRQCWLAWSENALNINIVLYYISGAKIVKHGFFCCTLHGTQYTHHCLKHMLPQNCRTYNDVFLLINYTKVQLKPGSL